jgi:hypothetical protein
MQKWTATIWTPRGWVTVDVQATTRGRAITAAARMAGAHRDNVGDIQNRGTVARDGRSK